MKTNLAHLSSFITYGKDLLEDISNGALDTSQTEAALLTLLRLESILDTGRILSQEFDSEAMGNINRGLNEIRDGIAKLIATFERTEVEALLAGAANNLKNNFLH